jgi:hypothetical protein
MHRRRDCRYRRIAGVVAGLALLVCPAVGLAQGPGPGPGHDSLDRPPDRKKLPSDALYQPSVPDPYDGQLFCPVTGRKLGLTQPPVPVQTAIGEIKPNFMGRVFGQKPTPGLVIYVCCPGCADKVRSNPEHYLGEVAADRSCFSFTYATAPAQRPERLSSNSPGSPGEPAPAAAMPSTQPMRFANGPPQH